MVGPHADLDTEEDRFRTLCHLGIPPRETGGRMVDVTTSWGAERPRDVVYLESGKPIGEVVSVDVTVGSLDGMIETRTVIEEKKLHDDPTSDERRDDPGKDYDRCCDCGAAAVDGYALCPQCRKWVKYMRPIPSSELRELNISKAEDQDRRLADRCDEPGKEYDLCEKCLDHILVGAVHCEHCFADFDRMMARQREYECIPPSSVLRAFNRAKAEDQDRRRDDHYAVIHAELKREDRNMATQGGAWLLFLAMGAGCSWFFAALFLEMFFNG